MEKEITPKEAEELLDKIKYPYYKMVFTTRGWAMLKIILDPPSEEIIFLKDTQE